MSEWKQNAAARRDARHAKDPGTRPVAISSKNTKKWCRGKTGVEHKGVCRDYAGVKGLVPLGDSTSVQRLYKGWKVLVCTECGKELATYYPTSWSKKPPNKPAWVTD
jgi:hypothetical protein